MALSCIVSTCPSPPSSLGTILGPILQYITILILGVYYGLHHHRDGFLLLSFCSETTGSNFPPRFPINDRPFRIFILHPPEEAEYNRCWLDVMMFTRDYFYPVP